MSMQTTSDNASGEPMLDVNVTPLIEPTPGLFPHRFRVPIFIMIGEYVPDIVMLR